MTRRRCRSIVLAGLALGGLGVTLGAVEISRVTPLIRDGQVLVSFQVDDAFTDELQEAIGSGLTTVFTFEVEVRRAASVWFDKTIASAAVSASVRYDNLTRRYQLSRTVDGRVEEASMTEDGEVVRQWMTAFERLPLFSATPLELNAEYYVRVRARTRPRSAWFLWPWDRVAASAVKTFTFIP